jgi:hypothetical protein
MIERRSEPRVPAEGLQVQIWGMDTHGIPFLQSAVARNLSVRGGLLTGIEQELRPGDLIGVQYEGRRARYRIVWVGYFSGPNQIMEAAIHKLDGDECPWKDALFQQAAVPR